MTVNPEWMQTFESWLPELLERIPVALEQLTAGREDIAAVAMYTDSDAWTLIPAALTKGALARLEAGDPRNAALYGWDPDEWDVLPAPAQAGELVPLMSKVKALGAEVDELDWRSFTILAWTWMTEGMKNLVNQGWFDTTYPGANVVFWITDHHMHTETMVEWAELLNPPERSAPYVRWLRENW